jgi:hypothetical protein
MLPVGVHGPSRVVELTYLGNPGDVVRSIYNLHADRPTGGRTGGSAVQEAIAAMLGVSQQSVSRYVAGKSEPMLSDDGWFSLVLAHFYPMTVAVRADRVASRAFAEVKKLRDG